MIMRMIGIISLSAALILSGCGSGAKLGKLPAAAFVAPEEGPSDEYIIGPLDQIRIFVWRNPELSTNVTVRPDGRITVPLIEDMAATGQTSTQLAKGIEQKLSVYIQNPIVSVIVLSFGGPLAQQVRVLGQAVRPSTISYRANMTLLDVMIAVGGLNQFAAGNRARLIRYDRAKNVQREYALKIESLLEDGKTSANVRIEPGDVILIPESFF